MKDNSKFCEVIDVLINKCIIRLEENKVDVIQPASVANFIMAEIDPEQKTPDMVHYLSSLQLRDKIRKVLAKCFNPVRSNEDVLYGKQGELFDGVLQERYPVKRGSNESQYVKRELMTDEELLHNADVLNKTGLSYVQHSDALYSYVALRNQSKKTG